MVTDCSIPFLRMSSFVDIVLCCLICISSFFLDILGRHCYCSCNDVHSYFTYLLLTYLFIYLTLALSVIIEMFIGPFVNVYSANSTTTTTSYGRSLSVA